MIILLLTFYIPRFTKVIYRIYHLSEVSADQLLFSRGIMATRSTDCTRSPCIGKRNSAEDRPESPDRYIVEIDDCLPECCMCYSCSSRGHFKWLKLRCRVRGLVEHKFFEGFIIVMVIFSSLVLVSFYFLFLFYFINVANFLRTISTLMKNTTTIYNGCGRDTATVKANFCVPRTNFWMCARSSEDLSRHKRVFFFNLSTLTLILIYWDVQTSKILAYPKEKFSLVQNWFTKRWVTKIVLALHF